MKHTDIDVTWNDWQTKESNSICLSFLVTPSVKEVECQRENEHFREKFQAEISQNQFIYIKKIVVMCKFVRSLKLMYHIMKMSKKSQVF